MSEQPPKLFISYAREDVDYKDQLVVHLEGLKQQGVISSWHDGLLIAGQQWDEEIVKHLDTSRIILLLISSDFIASDYIARVELKRAAARYERGEVTIIPILIRNVHGWQSKLFGKHMLGDFQTLPSNFKFIKDHRNTDAAFADIVAGIEKAVQNLKPVCLQDIVSKDETAANTNVKATNNPNDEPSDIEITILTLIAQPEFQSYAEEIALYLSLHIERVRYHLSNLERHGYVTSSRFYITRPTTFRLTDKSRELLMKKYPI